MRQDFAELAERHAVAAGQKFHPDLVASMLIEVGVRLFMTLHDPQKGAKLAKQHVKASIGICEDELQGRAHWPSQADRDRAK